jgi:hypothetical protein
MGAQLNSEVSQVIFRNRYGMWESLVSLGAGPGARSVLALLREPGPDGPSPEQMAALSDVRTNCAAIVHRCVEAVCETIENSPVSHAPAAIPSRNAIIAGLRLVQIHIPTISNRGLSPVGFEFDCDWSCENGIGVLTHQGQVLEVGGADVASLEWKSARQFSA